MSITNELNLEYLRVLASVLETKSAGATARELGVTQSAVSQSLRKLREIIGDELVYRQGNAMELTARAENMKTPLLKWFNQLEQILKVAEFDPSTSERVFYIATTDIVEQLFAPKIIKILQKRAPSIKLRFIRWEYERVENQLANNQIDMAIGVRSFDSNHIMRRDLYQESFVSLVRQSHPILKGRMSLEKFLAYPHVMTGPGDGKGAIDNYLDRLNRKRDLLYTVNSFASAPTLVENSDCILTAPQRFLQLISQKYKTTIFKTPIKMNSFSIKLFWAQKNRNEPANQWLRQIFYEVAQDL